MTKRRGGGRQLAGETSQIKGERGNTAVNEEQIRQRRTGAGNVTSIQ
jgi:hypothetical protein